MRLLKAPRPVSAVPDAVTGSAKIVADPHPEQNLFFRTDSPQPSDEIDDRLCADDGVDQVDAVSHPMAGELDVPTTVAAGEKAVISFQLPASSRHSPLASRQSRLEH